MLGRWGGDSVKLYVRDVDLEHASTWATQAMSQPCLETLVDGLVAKEVSEQVEAHYDTLNDVIDACPHKEALFVMGDFNARLQCRPDDERA